MRPSWIAIRYYHLGERSSVNNRSIFLLVDIEILNSRENDSFSMIETDVELPVLPREFVSRHGEADSLRLSDLERFEICSEGPILSSVCERSRSKRDEGETVSGIRN
jgi:hypothetical protein